MLPESWLVEPGNPVALADAIQVLLSSRHRREERAKIGRQPAYARFSDEQLMAARRNFWIATCAGGSALEGNQVSDQICASALDNQATNGGSSRTTA